MRPASAEWVCLKMSFVPPYSKRRSIPVDVFAAVSATFGAAKERLDTLWAAIPLFLHRDESFRAHLPPLRNCPHDHLFPDGHGEIFNARGILGTQHLIICYPMEFRLATQKNRSVMPNTSTASQTGLIRLHQVS